MLRKFVHTPKNGELPAPDKHYLEESYANNQFIKDYMIAYDNSLKESTLKAVEFRESKSFIQLFDG